MVLLRSIVKSGYRLKSLSDSDPHRKDQIADPVHNSHGGNRRVTINAGLSVQHHRGNAGQPLAHQTWKTGLQNPQKISFFSGNTARRKPARRPSGQKHSEQNQKTDHLRDSRGNTRSFYPHANLHHQQPVAENIQDPADSQSDHRQSGFSFIAQNIIHYKACYHQRSRQENENPVVLRERQDRVCTP